MALTRHLERFLQKNSNSQTIYHLYNVAINNYMVSLKRIVFQSVTSLLMTLPATPILAALTPLEINAIARQTTVLIAPGLTPELRRELEENRNNPLKQQGSWNPGSGVIVAHQSNKYYVLTVAHNFWQRHLDTKELWQQSGGVPFYGIRTWDGKIHKVEAVDDNRSCPLKGSPQVRSLIRFGCRDRFLPGTNTVDRGVGQDAVKGIDLALITFVSDTDYAVAPLGDASTVNIGDRVYISGWPDPEQELAQAGQATRAVNQRQRRFAWGPVTRKLNPDDANGGYSIFYTDCTRAGMSGGPVFDSNGRVVGNHGRGSQSKHLCGSKQPTSSRLESGDGLGGGGQTIDADILTRLYSGSQQVNKALDLIRQMGLNLPFNLNPPRPDLIKKGMVAQAIQAGSISSGRVEFDATQDSTAFDDPNDVITDIYKDYSSFSGVGSRLRDVPSGGCGTILLGDPCE